MGNCYFGMGVCLGCSGSGVVGGKGVSCLWQGALSIDPIVDIAVSYDRDPRRSASQRVRMTGMNKSSPVTLDVSI